MCARYTLKSSATVLQEVFELEDVPELQPRYNIAPTQFVPAIVNAEGHRELRYYQWGLVPSWAKDPSISKNLINAKGETLAEKPAFRAAFKRRRCLIPADGFYEWITVEPTAEPTLFGDPAPLPKAGKPIKQPYYFSLPDGRPFGIAGIHEYWEGQDASPIESCTLVTTDPNELLSHYHNRMPAIVRPEDYEIWLDPEAPPNVLIGILQPLPDGLLEARAVTRRLNNPRFDSPECIEPLAA